MIWALRGGMHCYPIIMVTLGCILILNVSIYTNMLTRVNKVSLGTYIAFCPWEWLYYTKTESKH